MRTAVVLVLTSCLSFVNCYKVIVVFPLPAPSHYILGNALARGLAEAGHDVTMLSPFEEKNPPKNGKYRDIVLTGITPERQKGTKEINMFDEKNPFQMLAAMMGNIFIEKMLAHTTVQNLMNSDEQFDAIIAEQFSSHAFRILQHRFGCPMILFSTLGVNRFVNNLVGNPAPLSYIPDIFLGYSSDMNFWQRTFNFIYGVVFDINRHVLFHPTQNKIMKKYYPNSPDIEDIVYNVSLVFLNEHESINDAVPHVPNMISIGGFHVKPPKALPKDLQEFIDGAEEGVIYFSMGSNLIPSQMPTESKRALLSVLGSLKQKVLWKWDEGNSTDIPLNFKISKWFPQQDILAHPNVRLFISHGGLLSTTETVYHGVPVLALPIFGDQMLNAARAEALGYGRTLPFRELTTKGLSATLHELLINPKYRENARERQRLLHDRPVKPMDLAVYWTEYVIRNKGAYHLRVGGIDLPWYKYLLLDVIAFLVFVTILVSYLTLIAIRRLYCRQNIIEKIKKF